MDLDQWITKVKDGQHFSEDELQLLSEYFAQLEHAKAAQSLNGKLEIAGRTIKVSSVADHVGVQDSGAKTADFDDDDGGSLALNAQSRAFLMQKLDHSGTASSLQEQSITNTTTNLNMMKSEVNGANLSTPM